MRDPDHRCPSRDAVLRDSYTLSARLLDAVGSAYDRADRARRRPRKEGAMGQSVSEKLFDAFSRNDIDTVIELADDDFELFDVPTGETFRGKEGARQNAEWWFRAFPDVEVKLTNVIVAGEWEVAEGFGRGEHTGTITMPDGSEIPPTGRSVELRFCSVARIRDGKVVEARDYYDVASMMQQLGLMPETAAQTA
jgi:ketosteroid isomerase-like protein